jgi:hypothetical protein
VERGSLIKVPKRKGDAMSPSFIRRLGWRVPGVFYFDEVSL